MYRGVLILRIWIIPSLTPVGTEPQVRWLIGRYPFPLKVNQYCLFFITTQAIGPRNDVSLPRLGSSTQGLNRASISRGPLSSRLSRRLHSGYTE